MSDKINLNDQVSRPCIRIAEILMTATTPLSGSYVDAVRESCRELREAQNIQVSGCRYVSEFASPPSRVSQPNHEHDIASVADGPRPL